MECRTCQHPDREEIDKAILRGEPIAPLARRFTLSKDSVRRHRDGGHISQALAPVTVTGEGATALERTEVLYQLAQALLAQALTGGGGKAVDLVREVRLTLKQIAEINGELRERAAQVVNIIAAPEWLALRGVILGALADHPQAREAVAQELSQLEAGS